MQRRSIIVTAAVALGLALGVIAGPSLRGSVANAQSQQPTQTQPAAPSNALGSLFLDKLAAALNIQRSALDSAIVSAGNSTADTAVQQGTLTQAQADALKARVAAGDAGALFGGHGGPRGGGPGMDNGVHQAMFDAAAKTLGITTTELQTQLRSGQTLAQLAAAHNTTEQAVTDAALAAAKSKLAELVTAGTLTQAQSDTTYTRLQQDGVKLLAPHGPGGPGGRGNHGVPGQTAPTTTPSTTGSTSG